MKAPRRWRACASAQGRARRLRREMTPAERKLWSRLRRRGLLGAHFRRQHPVGPFIVDFFCAKAKLVIEIDGHTHGTWRSYDTARTSWLREEMGYRVLRFTNAEVLHNIEAVLEKIAEALRKWSSPDPPQDGKEDA